MTPNQQPQPQTQEAPSEFPTQPPFSVHQLHVEVQFRRELLATVPSDRKTLVEYLGPKAPNGTIPDDELSSAPPELPPDQQEVRPTCVFARDPANGQLHLWDYQVRGFFKESGTMLNRVTDAKLKSLNDFVKLQAHKKLVDGLIDITPRRIYLLDPSGAPVPAVALDDDELNRLIRPLLAQTPQGPRVCIADSELVPIGTRATFTISFFDKALEPHIRTWLDYGWFHGLGQWRNAGFGAFAWREVPRG